MIADFAIHYDKGNPHCHIMLTTRAVDQDGFGEKVRAWDRQERVPEWRKTYETITNKHLEMAGREERICTDSNEKQGIDKIPTIHLGHASHEKEQRGERTIRGDRNREIEAQNRQLAELNKALAQVVTAKKKEAEEQPPPHQHHNRDPQAKRRSLEEIEGRYREAP